MTKPIEVTELNSMNEKTHGNVLILKRLPHGVMRFIPAYSSPYGFCSYEGSHLGCEEDLLGWIPMPVYKSE